jgi:hypothetical protein
MIPDRAIDRYRESVMGSGRIQLMDHRDIAVGEVNSALWPY